MKTDKLTCEKAKNLEAVSIAKKLGMRKSKQSNNQVWFFYNNERTASFKIDTRINKWYNFSQGIGGNTLDMVIHILNCSVSEALKFLSEDVNHFSFHQQHSNFKEEKSYLIKKLKPLNNEALIDYLNRRGINIKTAKKYCREVYYKTNNKNFFGIAFENNEGGIEVRSKYFKGCLNKKAVSFINNEAKQISIFEGFIDFLSYLTLEDMPKQHEDYLILHSVALLESTFKELSKYEKYFLYLDNDNSGDNAVSQLKTTFPDKVIDCRFTYGQYKDLNDFLIEKNKV